MVENQKRSRKTLKQKQMKKTLEAIKQFWNSLYQFVFGENLCELYSPISNRKKTHCKCDKCLSRKILFKNIYMKKIATIIIALVMFSCDTTPQEIKDRACGCSPIQRKKVTEFIQNSIRSANNMSDEEMEDVIIQLERTGVRTFCSQYNVYYYLSNGNRVIKNSIDSINYYFY